ncbi:hypothetical protein BZA05DRAFT_111389 [Tricharina praecox]|uniref:uncharacterized protein n=1 Tax=Tricharina praecox TaxID=43433 RepID=UPI00221FECE3|nr:uncharacterized protein BZA05DRAFT_111389 [Tricharina praecox]KAI5857970.1 hypothetical protein BZA05DRAFT_111389 [Tricharina praecox]
MYFPISPFASVPITVLFCSGSFSFLFFSCLYNFPTCLLAHSCPCSYIIWGVGRSGWVGDGLKSRCFAFLCFSLLCFFSLWLDFRFFPIVCLLASARWSGLVCKDRIEGVCG